MSVARDRGREGIVPWEEVDKRPGMADIDGLSPPAVAASELDEAKGDETNGPVMDEIRESCTGP